MIKAILLTLMTAITAVSGLFSTTTKAEEQVENKEIIKEIHHYEKSKLLFKAYDKKLYQILSYSETKNKPELIKYDVSTNYKVLFVHDKLTLIEDNNKILLFENGKLFKDITELAKDKKVLLLDKETLYYQKDNQLIKLVYQTKAEEIFKNNFHELLFYEYTFDNKISSINILTKDNLDYGFTSFNSLESSKVSDDISLAKFKEYKIMGDYLFYITDAEEQINSVRRFDGDQIVIDTKNKEFKNNFYSKEGLYVNGDVFKLVNHNIEETKRNIKVLDIKILNESVAILYEDSRNSLNLFYISNYSDKNPKETTLTSKYQLMGLRKNVVLLFNEKSGKHYNLHVNEFNESNLDEIDNKGFILFEEFSEFSVVVYIEGNKLHFFKASSVTDEMLNEEFDITELAKKNVIEQITDVLDNTKEDIKTKGNKFYKYFKENYLYFIFGFIGIFAVVFLATKAATRRKRRR